MTPAAPVLVQLDQHRLAARAALEEPAARAEGRFLEFALELQRLSCACVADSIVLRFADDLPALRRGDPDALARFQDAVHLALETLKGGAICAAAENGLSPANGEQMAKIGAEGFTARLNIVLGQAQEIGRA